MRATFEGKVGRIDGYLTRAIVGLMATIWQAAPEWRRVAHIYIPPGPSLGERIHRAVRDEVEYRREAGEVVQSPGVTLQRGRADCDCKSLLVCALAGAHGLPWRLVLLARHGGELVRVMPEEARSDARPFHIWVQLYEDGRWHDCETCHPAERRHLAPIAYGESPENVIRRLSTSL